MPRRCPVRLGQQVELRFHSADTFKLATVRMVGPRGSFRVRWGVRDENWAQCTADGGIINDHGEEVGRWERDRHAAP